MLVDWALGALHLLAHKMAVLAAIRRTDQILQAGLVEELAVPVERMELVVTGRMQPVLARMAVLEVQGMPVQAVRPAPRIVEMAGLEASLAEALVLGEAVAVEMAG